MKNKLCIMDHTGDYQALWDPADVEETSAARTRFDQELKKGRLAFRTDDDGQNGELIKEFDETAPRIVVTPMPVGG